MHLIRKKNHKSDNSSPRGVRLFVDKKLEEGALLELSVEQHHYLINVMRCSLSTSIALFNGLDGEWLALLVSPNKNSRAVQVIERRKLQEPEQKLALAFAPVKSQPTTFIVQKATELGVAEIYPIVTERSVVRKINSEKLIKVAIGAAEQSERLTVPKIHEICPLRNYIQDKLASYEAIIFLDEREHYNNMYDILNKLEVNSGSHLVLVGPEGSFSQAEKSFLYQFPQVKSVSLGSKILRSETAVIAALAAYQAICGQWRMRLNFRC